MISKHYFDEIFSLATPQALKIWGDNNLLENGMIDPPIVDDYLNSYYFDSVDGDDANNGLTELTAKKSVGALRTRLESLSDGDIILMKAGSYWQEATPGILMDNIGDLNGTGIAITSYGEGERPIYSNEHVKIFASGDISGPISVGGVDLWEVDTSAHPYPPIRRLWIDGVEYMGQSSDAFTWTVNDPIDGINTHWGVSGQDAFRVTFDPTGHTFKWHAEKYAFKFIDAENIILHGVELRSGRWHPGNSDSNALVISNNCDTLDVRMCDFGKSCDGIGIITELVTEPINNVTIRHNSFDTQYDENHLFNATLKYGRLYYGPSYHEDGVSSGNQSTPRGAVNAITCTAGNYNTLITNNYFRNWGHATVRIYDLGNGSDVEYPNSRTSGKFLYNDLGGVTPYGNRLDCTAQASNWEIAYNDQKGFSSNQLGGHSMWFHHNIIEGSYHSYFRDLNNGEGFTILAYYGDASNYHIFENNIFKNCDGSGISMARSAKDCIIRNNIFYNNDNTPIKRTEPSLRGGEGQMNFLIAGRPTDANNMIYNNLVFDTRTTITMTHSMETLTIFEEMTPTEFNAYNGSTWFSADGNVGGDPLFLDTVNFKVSAGSPAIDNGTEPQATIDYDGNTISEPYDIGLYNQ